MEDAIHTLTYAQSGVDISTGNRFVEQIKPLAASTKRPGVLSGLGGFGALFDLKSAGFQDPILVATTDGVGTKLRVALETGNHQSIGVDLVAMCVNDLIVQGAQPLFFLDYYATGKLDIGVGRAIVAGIAQACRESDCALVGGETAEMPGHYHGGDYDLAGFAVGAAERSRILTGERVRPGDRILGLGSDGIHSNGFSLVRKVVEKMALSYTDPAPFSEGQNLGNALLVPTRLYVRPVMRVVPDVKALAHITGGGIVENVPRILPKNCIAEIDAASWPFPPVFHWLKKNGNIPTDDFARTFNCGVGMVVIVAAEDRAKVTQSLEQSGEKVYQIGQIIEGQGVGVTLKNLESWD